MISPVYFRRQCALIFLLGARVKLVMATLAKEFAIPLAHTLDSASTIALGTAAFVCFLSIKSS